MFAQLQFELFIKHTKIIKNGIKMPSPKSAFGLLNAACIFLIQNITEKSK
jgi:hypothetical protein